ncbi:MAG: hypothetical protein JWM44_4048 [Bacilli bacterium]|nr:hypothetical protein [Bacilli bacterium]
MGGEFMFENKTIQKNMKVCNKNQESIQKDNVYQKKQNNRYDARSILQMQKIFGNKAVYQMMQVELGTFNNGIQRSTRNEEMSGLGGKEESEDEDWFINSDGSSYKDSNDFTLSSKVYDTLHDLISKYDVVLDGDIKRKRDEKNEKKRDKQKSDNKNEKKSDEQKSEDTSDKQKLISIGLANIFAYIESNKGLEKALDYFFNSDGLSFNQILNKCGLGIECHHILAEKLYDCLKPFKFSPAEPW